LANPSGSIARYAHMTPVPGQVLVTFAAKAEGEVLVALCPAVLGNPGVYNIGSALLLEIGASGNSITKLLGGYNGEVNASSNTPGICSKAKKNRCVTSLFVCQYPHLYHEVCSI
jgi:hypothetical protein